MGQRSVKVKTKYVVMNAKGSGFTMYVGNGSLYSLCKTYLRACFSLSRHPGNYYGTPKPPAEPSPVQPDVVDQVLFDEEFDTEVQRKRTTSVSKMDRKDSAAPEEEEEEERPPMVNGLAGERQHCLFLLLRHYIILRMQNSRACFFFFFPPYHSFLQTSGLAVLHARSALNHKK